MDALLIVRENRSNKNTVTCIERPPACRDILILSSSPLPTLEKETERGGEGRWKGEREREECRKVDTHCSPEVCSSFMLT